MLIWLTVGIPSIVSGQTDSDKQTVIQMCIDFDELQQYFHVDTVQGKKRLIIFDEGIVPTHLTLQKFGKPVVFMGTEELFFHNIEPCLDFDKFDLTSHTAEVKFGYGFEGLTIILMFEKVSTTWTIKSTTANSAFNLTVMSNKSS